MDEAIQKILSNAGVKLIDIAPGQAAVVPEGFSLQDLEHLLPAPSRIRQTVKTTSVEDFVAYVKRFQTTESTMFVAPNLDAVGANAPLVRCVLDHHGPGDKPSWCDHAAWFTPMKSPAYELLCAIDGKLMGQDEFAQRMRDLSRFCASHDPALLIEVAQSMTLTSTGEFASVGDDTSGSINLKYDVQVSASAGTQQRKLEVPKVLTFRVPVFHGTEAQLIKADLLYRLPKQAGGQVQLGIRLPDRRWTEQDLVNALAAEVREKTGLMTIVGSR